MSKRSGYRDASHRVVEASYCLFAHYGQNPDFMRDYREFASTHEVDLAESPMPRVWDGSAPLFCDAKKLADRWGLAASWAPLTLIWKAYTSYLRKHPKPALGKGIIHKRCCPLNAELIIFRRFPPKNKRRITFNMEYNPSEETRAVIREKVLEEFERQADIIEKRFEAKGMVPAPKRSELESHVTWLYLAICPDPKEGRPLRFGEIAIGEQSHGEHAID